MIYNKNGKSENEKKKKMDFTKSKNGSMEILKQKICNPIKVSTLTFIGLLWQHICQQ